MKTKKLIAATLAAGMALATVPTASHATYVKSAPGHTFGTGAGPWPIFVCAGGIILAAFAANYRDNRELTAPEAWSCGFLFLFSQPRTRG